MNKSLKYKTFYHHLVIKEDIPKLNRDILGRIKTAIETRLIISPENYGLPLRKTLKGYWKIRIGDYRVIFRIIKNEIHILAICHRNKVYSVAVQRRK